MISIAVAEGSSKIITAQLRRRLAEGGISVLVAEGCTPPIDILVAAPGANAPKLNASILVAPGDETAALAKAASPQAVVTYGMDHRDTITPSSLLQDGGMATVQRELVRLDGTIAEPQEVDLTQYQGTLMDKMAVAAVLLLTNHRDGTNYL